MGLDLVVEGCPRPGHEEEWREMLRRSFADEAMSDAEIARFHSISIPPYERVGAPRVGFDPAADAWILDKRQPESPEERAQVLQEFHGHYALELVVCDGLPGYSSGGLYEGVDETSFRGAFLSACGGVLEPAEIEAAWGSKFPEDAADYGRTLLAAADAAERSGGRPVARGFLVRLGLKKAPAVMPLAEQLDIVRAAGRWYVFWGERGHAVRAWF